jgi:DNA-binding transcriptional MerR regulator
MKRRDGTNLFTLGEMAKLTQLSPKTLRFYDETGTVSPCWRDPETGYRYYDTDQLYRLGNMRIAKALGLPMRGYDDVVVTSDELEGRDFDPVASRIREAQGEKAAEIAVAAQQLRLLERLSQDVSILRSHELGGGSFSLDCPRLHLLAYLPPRGDGPATLLSCATHRNRKRQRAARGNRQERSRTRQGQGRTWTTRRASLAAASSPRAPP